MDALLGVSGMTLKETDAARRTTKPSLIGACSDSFDDCPAELVNCFLQIVDNPAKAALIAV